METNRSWPSTLRCWVRLAAAAALVTLTVVAVLALARRAGADEKPEGRRSPVAVAAGEQFFQAFNGPAADRTAPLRLLMAAWATDPSDPRTNLLVGLNHLWIAAEGDRRDPRVIENLVLAESFLTRAQALAPGDKRIVSWLTPVRASLAQIERRPEGVEAARRELADAYRADPDFHSFVMALMGFESPRGSEPFERGLAALEAAKGCGETNPACRNAPHWPHNREAYLSFVADYQLKAGHVERAAEVLKKVQAEPGFQSWPYRAEAEARLASLESDAKLYADADPANDPVPLVKRTGMGCQACHRGS